ncbi:MAG: type II toxin-antitoxin system PemK/MazF family toxin [Candidatus Eremiobacteraeota bacterium]|nr:type II toxin-antitoxin system PemK/MazF family toxin [Candidatus Eremiobacteraeota bacterium]
MGLSFVPAPGSIVICNFEGYLRPEMVKKRRVVVISPMRAFKYVADATVIVVPLSEVEPQATLSWHHPIPGGRYPGLRTCWAKGDLVAHVGLIRLDRIFLGGNWIIPVMTADDLSAIRSAVAHALGIVLT